MTTASIAARRLTMTEARTLTDEVKFDAASLWRKLLELYEGGAHLALGHTSWAAYCRAEFDMGRSRSYQLLDAGRVERVVTSPHSWTETESPVESEVADPSPPKNEPEPLPAPTNEHVARKLTATARTDQKRARTIWQQVVAKHGADATPEQVAAIANGNGKPPEPTEDDIEWRTEMKALASDLRRVAKKADPKDARRALARWRPMYARLDRIAKT